MGLVLEGWLSCWKDLFSGKGGTALVFDAVAMRQTVAFGGGGFCGGGDGVIVPLYWNIIIKLVCVE
jgi:hypothetical protein